MASFARGVESIKRQAAAIIDPAIVRAACAQVGHRWRRRVLDPVATLEAFAAQILHGNTAIAHLTRLCGDRFGEAAYCVARQRLSVELCRAVLAGSIATQRCDDALATWHGHRTLLIDGSGCDTPDTPELNRNFGHAPTQRPGCGFPVVKNLLLFHAASLRLLGVIPAPMHSAELPLTVRLHPHLEPGDILVGDRMFCAYTHLCLLQQRGAHGVFRVGASRSLPFPARPGPRERRGYNRHRVERPVLVELIAQDDQVVEIVKPHNRPNWMSPEQFALLPSVLTVRALRYRVEQPGHRTREVKLLTTLIDAKKYPAADLAGLYRSRWQVEVNLRNLKQTLGMDSLRCKSAAGVEREILMFAMVYNAVCAAIDRGARRQGVPTHRVSFIDAMRWLQLKRQRQPLRRELKINPSRTRPTQPRAVKRRPKFPPLLIPRSSWLARLNI